MWLFPPLDLISWWVILQTHILHTHSFQYSPFSSLLSIKSISTSFFSPSLLDHVLRFFIVWFPFDVRISQERIWAAVWGRFDHFSLCTIHQYSLDHKLVKHAKYCIFVFSEGEFQTILIIPWSFIVEIFYKILPIYPSPFIEHS